jgi:predicted MFS family arabinose efflux permease
MISGERGGIVGPKNKATAEWREVRIDSALVMCIIHGSCLFYVVSQMKITLPQYFVASNDVDSARMIFLLISWSAFLIVALHPVYHKVSAVISRRHQLILGGVLVIGSQIILCWVGSGYDVFVVGCASSVFTAGELFLFPLYSVMLGGLASRSRQGAYAGLGSLYILGSAVGPIGGAFLLSRAGPSMLFLVSAAVGVASLYFSLVACAATDARLARAT